MNSPIGLDSTIKRAYDVVSCDLDEETALMSVEQGKYYGIDPIGSGIWNLIEQARVVSELCDLLLEEFEGERSQCEHDVLAFLNELAEEKLIQVVDESTA